MIFVHIYIIKNEKCYDVDKFWLDIQRIEL